MPEEGPPGPKCCNSLMMFCALKDCYDYSLVNTLLEHKTQAMFYTHHFKSHIRYLNCYMELNLGMRFLKRE